MDVVNKIKQFLTNSFRIPAPFNWGYPYLFACIGAAFAYLLTEAVFGNILPFSTTSLVGVCIITILVTTFGMILPSVFLASRTGLNITGQHTGIGTMIMSLLSGVPLFLASSSSNNMFTYLWMRMGNSVIFPTLYSYTEKHTPLTLSLQLLTDTLIPALGISIFFYGIVWSGIRNNDKRLSYLVIPLMLVLFQLNFAEIPGILIMGFWLCLLRRYAGNIWGPFLCLVGSRITGLMLDGIISQLDLTVLRTYSDIPSTMFYSSAPSLVMAIILFAFFRKALGEFNFTYNADIYGDEGSNYATRDDSAEVAPFVKGFNAALIVGFIIIAVFWGFVLNGMRL